MPPLTATPLLQSLIDRDIITNASNATGAPPMVQVVCAWPVSGQYGLGTRIIYYVLVATCVLARRIEKLRNACLAAALLLPAVAAIHAVVLAAVHVDTAIDMDIYGAFQICSIGILAAPITVSVSKTYFNDPGRNLIFIWTGLLLTGMLSLTVEFFRSNVHDCYVDDSGMPIDPNNFPFQNASCNLTCTNAEGLGGPYSPIRQGASNEIFVIPAPRVLTFNAATLLAAGSSIPPILTLIFTWEKILEINWKRSFGRDETQINEPIEGTNGATLGRMNFINDAIRNFLTTIQIPVFGAIVIAILIFGEINFWSTQVNYQTEPFTSVGQWANVVATALVVLGSLFYVRTEREVPRKEEASSNHSPDRRSSGPRNSSRCDGDHGSVHSRASRNPSRVTLNRAADSESIYDGTTENARGINLNTSRAVQIDERERDSIERENSVTYSTNEQFSPITNKHRNKVARVLNQVGDYLGTPAADRYDDSKFRQGQASEFPAIPGEAERNRNFERIRDKYYNSRHQDDENAAPGLSRVNSYSSMRLSEGGQAGGTAPQPRSPSRSNTTPAEQTGSPSFELSRTTTSPATGPTLRIRRDTLEVPNRPSPVHIHTRNSLSSATTSPTTIVDAQGSPRIVVSSEPEESTTPTPTTGTSPPYLS